MRSDSPKYAIWARLLPTCGLVLCLHSLPARADSEVPTGSKSVLADSMFWKRIGEVIADVANEAFWVGPPSGKAFIEPMAQGGTPLRGTAGAQVGLSVDGGFRPSWLFDHWGGAAVTASGEIGPDGWKSCLGYAAVGFRGQWGARLAVVRVQGASPNATPGEWYVGPEIELRYRGLRGNLGGLYRVAGDDRSGRLIPSASVGIGWAWKP